VFIIEKNQYKDIITSYDICKKIIIYFIYLLSDILEGQWGHELQKYIDIEQYRIQHAYNNKLTIV